MNVKFRKLGLTALLVAVILVAVGVMVFPPPNSALAVNVYKIHCELPNGGGPAVNVNVRILLDGDQFWQAGWTDNDGNFVVIQEGNPRGWTAEMIDPNWEFLEGTPVDNNPASFTAPGVQEFTVQAI